MTWRGWWARRWPHCCPKASPASPARAGSRWWPSYATRSRHAASSSGGRAAPRPRRHSTGSCASMAPAGTSWCRRATTGCCTARRPRTMRRPWSLRPCRPCCAAFPWPKSMRWGTSAFTWVRPLRRILCTLDGHVVPFTLADGADDGHGLASGDLTEGHRFHAPGAFGVRSFTEWEEGLRARKVIVAAGERRRLVAEGIAALAAERQLTVVPRRRAAGRGGGPGRMAGAAAGADRRRLMDLPPEVMQVSMRVNQRYFACATRPAGRRRGSRSPPTSRRMTVARRSWRATSACCAPGSATRGISGIWTGAPRWRTGWRRWTASRSMPSSARRGRGSSD